MTVLQETRVECAAGALPLRLDELYGEDGSPYWEVSLAGDVWTRTASVQKASVLYAMMAGHLAGYLPKPSALD